MRVNPRQPALYAGCAIAAAATLLGLLVFPGILATYRWWSLMLALLSCSAYAGYLARYDATRLRSFLKSYLIALLVLCLAPSFILALLAALAAGRSGAPSTIVLLFPLLCAVGAIARTHILAAEPDIVVARTPPGD